VPAPLNYMPFTYRRRKKAWPLYALAVLPLTAIVAVIAAVAEADDIWVGGIVLIGAGAFPVIVIASILAAGRWELIIEGRTLRFRRPSDSGWGTFQLDEVISIYEVSESDDSLNYEFAFKGRRRLRVERELFDYKEKCLQAIQTVRPDLEVKQRSLWKCHVCCEYVHTSVIGHSRWIYPGHCKACGAAIPRPFGRIPADGLHFPEGLAGAEELE
jgi:hypothetical protein